MTYYAIYRITNKINGKIYIGSHKTNTLDDSYFGSGKYLKRSIAKYGIEHFTKEILFVFDTAEEMYAKEAELVNADFLAEENTYNLKIGGIGGWDYINKNSELRIAKNQKARRIANERGANVKGLQAIKELRKNKDWVSQCVTKRKSTLLEQYGSLGNKFRLGIPHTDETKKKIGIANSIAQAGSRNSQFGKLWITNEIESIKISKSDPIPDGWRKGRKMNYKKLK